MRTDDHLFKTVNLTKEYAVKTSGIHLNPFKDRDTLSAVDSVNFEIGRGDIIGLAGQSGCGKSTLGNLLLRLTKPSEGEILYKGNSLNEFDKSEMKQFRSDCQIIFQDPYESLNPRFTVARTIIEPLRVHGIGNPKERESIALDALEDAGLSPAEQYLSNLPSELSGGERQRVSIARALVLEPDFILADEPTSMLDVSISSSLLNEFKRLQNERDITMLYISHDLSTINYLCDKVAIMYGGRIVEYGETEDIIHDPSHPYTNELIAAVPGARDVQRELTSDNELHTPRKGKGCRYSHQCQYAKPDCEMEEPSLEPLYDQRKVACYYPISES